MSLKDEFFALKGELRVEEYTLPSGGKWFVREISSAEWLLIKLASWKYQKATGEPDKLNDARVAAYSVTERDGSLVFDPNDEEELKRLANEPDRTFGKLMAVVNRVNDAGEKEKDNLKKSSETSPNLTLSTASPETPAA